MSSPDEERRRWREYGPELGLLLWALWDPIEAGVPLDEYESYAPTIWQLLHAQAEAREIGERLDQLRTESLGLPANRDRDVTTAERLKEWWYWRFEFPTEFEAASPPP
jgi:hypothetical protein